MASVAPGIIDTDMQKQLRGAAPPRFAAQGAFAGFHAGGALDSPAAAAKVIAPLERDDYGANPVTDVRAAQAVTDTGTRSASAHISS